MADETVSTEIVPADETVSADITKDPNANPSAELTDAQAQPDTELADEDSLTFSDGVIEKIAALSLREVDNVVGARGNWLNRVQDVLGATDAAKGVSVEVARENAVRINISVLIRFGAYAPQVFEDVKQAVSAQVTSRTGLEVAGINLRIEDVLTEEEYERMRGSEKAGEEPAKDATKDAIKEATKESRE
ncbi:MAG: Asp23/Gls24 family envelope stress response protein [Lancefieldella rimae]